MSYQSKYLKYKAKYLKLKNLHGGNTAIDLLYRSTLTEEELTTVMTHIYRLYDFKFEDQTKFDNLFTNFITGCERIAQIINEKAIINVIAPGDSPAKIVKYLQRNNLCPNCNFISFSLSEVYYYTYETNADPNKLYNYLAIKLPSDNLDNTVIMDYVARGGAIKGIANTYSIKLDNKKFADKLLAELVNVIKNLSKNLLKEDGDDIELLDPIHIIDIHFYFYGYGITHFLISAEDINTRCMPKNEKFEVINEAEFKSYGCDFFVYMTILHKMYGGERLFKIIDDLKMTLQRPIEDFYREYGSNKIVDLTIYNEDGITTSQIENIMISQIKDNNIYIIINQERAFGDYKNYISYSSIIEHNTMIKKELVDFKCIEKTGYTYKNIYSIYNITYNNGENEISALNMVYVDDDNYLKFIPLDTYVSLKYLKYYNRTAIKIFPNQLISTELVSTLSGEMYTYFLQRFTTILNKKISITLTDSRQIKGIFTNFLDNNSGIIIKKKDNTLLYILYYLIDMSQEIIIKS